MGQPTVEGGRADALVDPAGVLSRARSLLGEQAADLVGVVPRATPTSTQQVASLLRVAGEEGWRVRPVGAGLDPREERRAPPDLLISSAGLAGAFEHEPVDLNVRVGAGMRVGDLGVRVAEGRQWLALDPPGGRGATVGGIVGTGLSGPLRALYGRPRDQVLGLTLVDGSGRVLSLGGRVVKNVAGFDLVRLATGSRGRLGVITEITFRLYPRPEEDRTLVWCHDDAATALHVGRAIAVLPFPLAAAELLAGDWPDPVPSAPVRTVVRLLGSRATNERITEELTGAAGEPDRQLTGDASAALFDGVSSRDGAGVAPVRIRMLPSTMESVVVDLSAVCDRLAAHLLEGTIRGTFAADPSEGERRGIRDRVEMVGGRLRFLDESSEGTEATLARLASDVVRVFDPRGILGAGLDRRGESGA